jgi:glycosyltransferase involved in cell wall biosynthesis
MCLVRVAVNVEQLLYRPPGGIGRYTQKLVTLLPQLFPDDEVVAFTARHRRQEIDIAWRPLVEGGAPGAPPVPPVPLSLPRPVLYEAWNTLGWPRLAQLSRGGLKGVDVVHAPSVAVPPTGRTPLVVTVHDVAPLLFPETFPRHGRWFHRRGLAAAARRADLVVTVSRAAAAEIDAYTKIRPDRVRVVPNGVDHVRVSEEEVAAAGARHGLADAPYILWVGSLEPRKNVTTLVEAFAAVVAAGQDDGHKLVLASQGGWLSSDLIPPSLADRLAGRLRRLGAVAPAELRALYAGATLFALPSRHEGFGLTVLEAMVQGAPVVCADIPALREVTGALEAVGGSTFRGVHPQKSSHPPEEAAPAARLVPPDDTDAWAQALQDLIRDPAERRRLAAAGRQRASGFSWEHTIRATRAVYAEALAGAPRRAG